MKREWFLAGQLRALVAAVCEQARARHAAAEELARRSGPTLRDRLDGSPSAIRDRWPLTIADE